MTHKGSMGEALRESAYNIYKKLDYTKAYSEHYYYKFLKNKDYGFKTQINLWVMMITALIYGYLSQKTICVIWKPLVEWSLVESTAIFYLYWRIGYCWGANCDNYLNNISNGRFDHKSYDFYESKPGDTSDNPIDLTQEDEAPENEEEEATSTQDEAPENEEEEATSTQDEAPEDEATSTQDDDRVESVEI